jgi:uncharacterized Rmd1/YagE family protein
MKKKIDGQLLKLLLDFIKENEIDINSSEVDMSTKLIGSNSIFDSIELVSFIVETEQFIDDNYDVQVQLASESAMSRRRSPFISLNSLKEYIIELSDE